VSNPDIQYFDHGATWMRPEGAAAVDVLIVGAGAGGTADGPGASGEVTVKRLIAPDIPRRMNIEIGRGGRGVDGGGDGRDGCVVVVTHLAGEENQ
jgi:hypothetical protein